MQEPTNLQIGDVINLYPDYSWKTIIKAPHRALLNKAIQLYSHAEWGVLSPPEPPVHQGIYLGDREVFDVTWPKARIGSVSSYLGGRRFKVFRYQKFNMEAAPKELRAKIAVLMREKASSLIGYDYDVLDLAGFLVHALTEVIGWPAAATKILPIIFGKNWKLAPFEIFGMGQKRLVCSVGVATVMVAVHEAMGTGQAMEPIYPRPFAVYGVPGDLDVESHGAYYRAVEAIDPSCVEVWKSEFTEVGQ